MRTVPDTGQHMAELLAGLWPLRRSPWFLDYIEVLFGVPVSELPDLKGVVVSEAESGSVRDGMVQGTGVRDWVADEAGFRDIAEAEVPPWARDTNAAGDDGRLYSGWAKFHFFADGDRVAVVAVFGPELRGRMVGRLIVVDGVFGFTDVRIPRPPGVRAVRPGSLTCPALALGAARQV